VWLGEQRVPIERRAAIKIIKPGMDSRAVIARFEQERQALAMMDHPNIARVLDAGATAAGRPFFAMEYIKGESITRYCDRNRLTIGERLALFAKVCDAVHHAHTKGVIHRDIKPSNILVTIGGSAGEPRPVVIDFGVAKAIAARLTAQTIYTERGQLIGTPEYMSPEQAEMAEADIDTRSDVYSLGVTLYELLTGATPFDARTFRAAGIATMQKMIREIDPPRPSVMLSNMGQESSGVAAARHIPLGDLRSQLRRELEWIPLKAMRKDRRERYRSASEMADDIGNYLADRPLIAGPETTQYKVRKFVRRHKGPVAAGAAIAVSLVAAAGVSMRFGLSESSARRRESGHRAAAEANAAAESKARKRAEAINAFVTKALQSSDPSAGGKQDTTIADAMKNALREIESGAFRDDPETEAGLKDTIATVLWNNGRAAEAEPLFVQAVDMHRRLFAGDHESLAVSLNGLAGARNALGRAAEAEPLLIEALAIRQRLASGDDAGVASSLNNLALAKSSLGRAAEAEPLFVQALEMFQRLYAGDHASVANSLNSVAGVRNSLGRGAEAEPMFVQALEMRQRLFKDAGGDHPDVATSLNNLASVRQSLGRAAEAEPLHVQSLEMNRRLFKGDHPAVANGLSNVAHVCEALGRAAEAEPLYVESLEMHRRLFPGDHPSVALSLNSLAFVRQTLGRVGEAEPQFVEALEMSRRLFKGDHPSVANGMNNLASARQTLGRAAEAEPLMVAALAMRMRLFKDGGGGGDHPQVAQSLSNLARTRQMLGKTAEARRGFGEAVAMLRRLSPTGSPNLARGLWRSGVAMLESGDAAAALGELEEAVSIAEKMLRPEHPHLREYRGAVERCRAMMADK